MRRAKMLVTLVGIFWSSWSIAQGGGVPAKWQRENIIVHAVDREHQHLLSDRGKLYTFKQELKFKIELNKAKGAAELNRFIVPADKDFTLKVTKEDGTINTYDEGDAEDLEPGKLPSSFFERIFTNEFAFEQVELDDLAEGDIIDFSYSTNAEKEVKEMLEDQCTVLESNNHVMALPYPVARYTLNYVLSNELFINYGRMNGAPIMDELGSYGDEDEMVFKYRVEDTEIEKGAAKQYVFPVRAYKTAKIEVLLCDKGESEESQYIAGVPNEVMDDWDEILMKEVIYNKMEEGWDDGRDYVKDYMEFAGEPRGANVADRALEHYYRNLQAYVYSLKAIKNYNDDVFMGMMMELLEEQEFEYDVIFGFNQVTADPDEMVMNNDLRYGLRITDRSDVYYVYPIRKYSRWNDANHEIAGSDGYIFHYDKSLEDCKLEPLLIPQASPADNQMMLRRTLIVGDSLNVVVVNQMVQAKGSEKIGFAEFAVTDEEYNEAIVSRMQMRDYADRVKADSIAWQKEFRQAYFNAKVLEEFDSVQIDRFNPASTGVDDKNEWTGYRQRSRVYGLINQNPQDSLYYLDLGKFLVPQIEPTSSMLRDAPVCVGYPMIADTRIVLKLNGIQAFGAEKFEKEIDADIATLLCKVRIKDDRIIVNYNVVFKEGYADADDWQKLQLIAAAEEELSKLKVTIAKF